MLVHIAVTEASCVDNVPPLDDAHGHAGNLVTCHETEDKGREIAEKLLFASSIRLERRQANGDEERRPN
jgi:hypothetical protein